MPGHLAGAGAVGGEDLDLLGGGGVGVSRALSLRRPAWRNVFVEDLLSGERFFKST